MCRSQGKRLVSGVKCSVCDEKKLVTEWITSLLGHLFSNLSFNTDALNTVITLSLEVLSVQPLGRDHCKSRGYVLHCPVQVFRMLQT